MSFFNYPDNVLPAGNEVLVDFSARITDEMTAKKFTSKEVNNLPDSDFAYISPGGKKDSEGKTIPRSLRHLPIPDAAHVRNALARLDQTKIPPAAKKAALAKIKRKAEELGVHVSESDGASEKQKAAKEKFLEMIRKKKGGDKKDSDKKSDDKKSSKKDESKGGVKEGKSDYPHLDKPTSAKTKKQWEKTDKKELDRDTKKEKKEHEKDAVKDDESKIKKLKKGKPSEKKRAEVFYLKKDEKIDKKKASLTVSTVASSGESGGPEPSGPAPVSTDPNDWAGYRSSGPEASGPEPSGPEPSGPEPSGPEPSTSGETGTSGVTGTSGSSGTEGVVAAEYPTVAFKPVPFQGTLESAPYSKLLEPVDWEKLKKELNLNTLWFKKPQAPKVDYRKFLDPHYKP